MSSNCTDIVNTTTERTAYPGSPRPITMGASDLAATSGVSLPTIKRLETKPGILGAHVSTQAALRKALDNAGIEFIEENGSGPGVRLRKRQQKMG
jgi:hypothetical protein